MGKRRTGKKRRETLPEKLVRHARVVMHVLGTGHSERVYHKAVITSLNRELVPHRSEVITPIHFMGEIVGFGRCDLIVGNQVVEFKANARRPSKASPQLQKYLESLSRSKRAQYRGMVVNFNQRSGLIDVHSERLAKPKKKTSC
jgi:GxxExxY protein